MHLLQLHLATLNDLSYSLHDLSGSFPCVRIVMVLNDHTECQLVCAHHFSLTCGEQRTPGPMIYTDPDAEDTKKGPAVKLTPSLWLRLLGFYSPGFLPTGPDRNITYKNFLVNNDL